MRTRPPVCTGRLVRSATGVDKFCAAQRGIMARLRRQLDAGARSGIELRAGSQLTKVSICGGEVAEWFNAHAWKA